MDGWMDGWMDGQLADLLPSASLVHSLDVLQAFAGPADPVPTRGATVQLWDERLFETLPMGMALLNPRCTLLGDPLSRAAQPAGLSS